jgi:hypothetical protein
MILQSPPGKQQRKKPRHQSRVDLGADLVATRNQAATDSRVESGVERVSKGASNGAPKGTVEKRTVRLLGKREQSAARSRQRTARRPLEARLQSNKIRPLKMLCRHHQHEFKVALMNATCHLPLNASISQVVSLFNINLQKNLASGLFLGRQAPFLMPQKSQKSVQNLDTRAIGLLSRRVQ